MFSRHRTSHPHRRNQFYTHHYTLVEIHLDQPRSVIEPQLMVRRQENPMVVQDQLSHTDACAWMAQKMDHLAREYAACNLQARQLLAPMAALPSSAILPRVSPPLHQPPSTLPMSASPSSTLLREVVRSFDPLQTSSPIDDSSIMEDSARRTSSDVRYEDAPPPRQPNGGSPSS